MCMLKSGIVLKNKIFVPEYDSHTRMLEELGIKDDYLNASKTFVRVELSPIDGNVFSDIDTWKLRVDQDITPEWYDEDTYKPQVVEAVKKWAKDHVHIDVDNLEISAGEGHYIKGCKNVVICDNATVKYICDNAAVKYICDNATVKHICGNATVEHIYGNATVKYICDNATVKHICGNATVEHIYGNATVKYICDNATVEHIRGNATVEKAKGTSIIVGSSYDWNKKETLILAENATFKDCQTKTIYQSGGSKLVGVENGNKIEKE